MMKGSQTVEMAETVIAQVKLDQLRDWMHSLIFNVPS